MRRKQDQKGKTKYEPTGKDRERKGENKAAVCMVWTLVLLTCMVVMLMFAADKTIVIADVSQAPSGLPVNTEQQGTPAEDKTLTLYEDQGRKGNFYIPLPKGIRAEEVTVENRYMDRELLLYIQGGEESFYEENRISGDIAPVLSARCEMQEEGMLLKIRMGRVLEYRSTMDSSGLTINWYEPEELYDYIVVIDPAWGGSEKGIDGYGLLEKDLTLQVAKQIQKQFDLEGVRLYCTRTEDVDVPVSDRIRLAEETGADFYVRLCAGEDVNSSETYGIAGFYNEEYYIPGLGNPQLADFLTREVTVAASNRALGLFTAGEESILRQLQMPAAEISLGFLSNPREEYLLGQESYQEKLAAGCISALVQAAEFLEEAGEEGEGQ